MEFKVKCVYSGDNCCSHFTVGEVYEVTEDGLKTNQGQFYTLWKNGSGENNFEKLRKWFVEHSKMCDYRFELVEDKKMFTKSDLKNGDVIVRRNGWVEIVIVDLDVLVSKHGWDSLYDINEDLTDCDSQNYSDEYDIVKVYRPRERYHCVFDKDAYTKGTLVYDRERDTKKPLYNGKVVCVELNGNTMYTVGKIYQFKDGIMTADNGLTYPSRFNPIHNFEAWNKWTASKFIEIKE
jgi:hypothetical protein